MRHISCTSTRAAALRAENKVIETRKKEDVAIFHYWYLLSSADENPLVERGGPSLVRSSEDDNIFFQVSKDRLIESQQFSQVTNPTEGVRLLLPRGPRLGITQAYPPKIYFLIALLGYEQCYAVYDSLAPMRVKSVL